MKKYLCLLLVSVMLFSLAACNDSPDVSDGSGGTTTTTTNTDRTPTDEELYTAFLQGKLGAIDKDGGRVSLRDYMDDDYDNRYALYDMNGDSRPELLLRTRDGLLILWVDEQDLQVWYNGTIYETPLNNGAIYYERPGGAPTHTDYQYITLTETGEILQKITFAKYDDDGEKTFFVNGQSVESDAYTEVYNTVMPKTLSTAIVWKSLSDADATTTTHTPASTFTLEKDHFTYTVTEEGDAVADAKIVTVTATATGKAIQTIRFAGNEWFTQAPLYRIDVNFDGYEDLIVPFQRPAHGGYFQAYIWDAAAGQYRHAPTFERIANVALDADSGMVLSRRTSDKITSCSMYRYDTKQQDFVVVRTLYWEPRTDEKTMQVKEHAYNANGESETVQEFTVPAVNTIDVDRNDARMAPYFADGSLWDLGSIKWDVPLISRSQYAY